MFSLISGLPSTPSASGDPPLFGCFKGTTPESDFFTACMSVVWFWAFTDRPGGWLPSGAAKISRFSCIQFLSVHGVVDYVGPKAKLALTLAFVLPSLCVYKVGALKLSFSKLSAPAHFRLCLRFSVGLTASPARLEVRMVRYSFSAGLFHSLLYAGLSRRSHTWASGV